MFHMNVYMLHGLEGFITSGFPPRHVKVFAGVGRWCQILCLFSEWCIWLLGCWKACFLLPTFLASWVSKTKYMPVHKYNIKIALYGIVTLIALLIVKYLLNQLFLKFVSSTQNLGSGWIEGLWSDQLVRGLLLLIWTALAGAKCFATWKEEWDLCGHFYTCSRGGGAP